MADQAADPEAATALREVADDMEAAIVAFERNSVIDEIDRESD
jgi:hypothetical protein